MSRRRKDPVTKAKRRRNYELRQQEIAAATRAKYGPLRRAAPVTIKRIEDGEVMGVVDAAKFKSREASPMLEGRARAAGFASYGAYLASGYWAGIRARVLARDGHRCVFCRSRKNLQVHHDRYEFLGSERLEFLKTICGQCHRRIHR